MARPSLKSLASSLGLSVTTVSRALAGYGDVAVDTRRRVRDAATRARYRPHITARRLQKGRSEAIALLLPTDAEHFSEPMFMELLAAIGKRLSAAGLDLAVSAAAPGEDEIRAYRRLVEEGRADGAIVVRTRARDPRIAYLIDHGFPFVAHGRCEEARPYAFIDGDGAEAFARVTRLLLARGHRRVAMVGAPREFMFAALRESGWRAALDEAGLAPAGIAIGAPDEDGGHAAARRLLEQPTRPDAILCATDRMAFGALRAIDQAGLRPGRDIAVIGHDNLSLSRFTDPPLTTLDVSVAHAGARLVDMLLALLGGARPEDHQELITAELIERASHQSHNPGGNHATSGLSQA